MEDLDKVFASSRVLSILKLLIVMSTCVGLGVCCFDLTTAFVYTCLDSVGPPIFPGGVLPREDRLAEVEESG